MAICPRCGYQNDERAAFCLRCGSPIKARSGQANPPQQYQPTPQDSFNAGKQVTPNIVLGSDGKYRWIYEMSLFKNPTLFVTVWKIFFFIILGIFAFTFILDLANGNTDGETLLNTLKFLGIVMLGMTALVVISFLIYAAIMGGKYIVLFEMDKDGINHAQVPSQAKKAQGIAAAAFTVGMLTGNRAAYTGGFAAANTEMYTGFAKTRKVRFYPRRHLIKIRRLLFRNQIYAKPEDFAFVQHYILAQVPDQAKPREYRQKG